MKFKDMLKNFTQLYDYEAELNNFESYILNEKKCPVNETTLGGIRTDDIISSINYNIKHNQYASKSIALKYTSAIAQFYRYAISNGWFTNDNLLDNINAFNLDENSYFARLNQYIADNTKLKDKISKEICSEDEIIILVNTIDEFISKKEKHNNKIGFERVTAMICIKLILLTGIKYNVARSIKLKDINISINTIEINGFSIRLPINLSQQFKYYVDLRKQIATELEESLFVGYDGKQWGKTTASSKMTNVLSRCLGRDDTTGITKYGINSLLKVGVGINEIEKLTSAKKDMIRSCELYSEETYKQKMDKYMNMHICNMDIYYKL